MEEVTRPGPRRGPAGRLARCVEKWNDGVAWFGLGRLIASAAAVVMVCIGAYWLVRSPRPPIEASLPQAAVSSAAPVRVTLPPPGTPMPSSTVPVDGPITVHVAGAVRAPGVYQLRAGDRVGQAISAAGGSTADGRPDELNLAAVLVDGSRILVPVEGEEVIEPTAVDVAPVDAEGTAPTGPVDVNRASTTELETLPGVGPATAAAIVLERERNGPFLNVDDLERVSGVGPGKIEQMRGLVTV